MASFFSLGNIFLGCPISILLHITGIESLNLLKASILFEVDWYSFISGFALASFLGLGIFFKLMFHSVLNYFKVYFLVYIFLLQFGSRKSDLIYLQLGNLLTLPLTLSMLYFIYFRNYSLLEIFSLRILYQLECISD